MSDDYLDLITPTLYEPCGFDYITNNVNYRKIVNKNVYIISSFDSFGNITSNIITGLTNNEGKIQQNGSLIFLTQGLYYFFVSITNISNTFVIIKKNICSNAIQISDKENQSIMLPYFPKIQNKINGTSIRGTFSEPLITILKRFENPPVHDGKVGLHLPGDKTVTYGYGEVLKGIKTITNELRMKYPNMTLIEADHRLRNTVIIEYIKQLNNRINYRSMQLTDNQFDALLTVEYNSGDSGLLLDEIKIIEHKNSANKQTEIFNAFIAYETKVYPGVIKRRKAEASIYLHGYYDENFTY